MVVELSGKRKKGYGIGVGKELNKAVVLAAEWFRPDPWGSSRVQIIPQSWSSLESRGPALWITISVRYFLRIALKGGRGLAHPPNIGSDQSFKDNAPEKGPLWAISSRHLKLVDGCIDQWRKSGWAQNIQCTSVQTGILILLSGSDFGVWNKKQIYLDLQEMKDLKSLDSIFKFPFVHWVILNNWWSYSDSDPFLLHHPFCVGCTSLLGLEIMEVGQSLTLVAVKSGWQ